MPGNSTEKADKNYWNPYIAGTCAGVVLILSVWVAGKYFGASTAFVRSAGLIENAFNAEHVAKTDYFTKTAPKIDWQWVFVVGILIGSLIASKTSGTFRIQAIPSMWQERFGSIVTQRGLVAFIGGTVAMFGARLAGG